MTNEVTTFTNSEFGSIRTITIDNEPWFVGKDIAQILGYTNPSKALQDHVDAEDKLNNESLLSLGQRGGWLINESGMYSLILGSKLPSARRFKHWVTAEVLPSIRKHGLYAIDELLADPDLFIRALQELKSERAKNAALAATVSVQKQQIAEMKPKASYFDVILNCKDAVAITTIAKDYGKSGQWLNEYLHKLGIQFKQGNIWLLYQKYAENGYTCTKTHSYPGSNGEIHSKIHTYWTQKGRLFIYELLKSNGYLPLIEQGLDFEVV